MDPWRKPASPPPTALAQRTGIVSRAADARAGPTPVGHSAYAGAHLVTPNVQEMFAFTGIRVDSDETAAAACAQILDRVAIDAVLLTQGEAGMDSEASGHVPLIGVEPPRAGLVTRDRAGAAGLTLSPRRWL